MNELMYEVMDEEYFKSEEYAGQEEGQVMLFHFQKAEVRTVVIDGDPWFVAKDVCAILGLKNTTEALRNFREKDVNTFSSTEGIQTGPGNSNFKIINEPGLYRLIFKSRRPEALAFQDWVYEEVLPSVRKSGFYGTVSKRIPGYGYLNNKLAFLEADLKKELPGYNGRVKAGSDLPVVAQALVRLIHDFLLAANVTVAKHLSLEMRIEKLLAEKNPSLEDIRYWIGSVKVPGKQKQLSA
jgi:prophage antirepressor-like protein